MMNDTGSCQWRCRGKKMKRERKKSIVIHQQDGRGRSYIQVGLWELGSLEHVEPTWLTCRCKSRQILLSSWHLCRMCRWDTSYRQVLQDKDDVITIRTPCSWREQDNTPKFKKFLPTTHKKRSLYNHVWRVTLNLKKRKRGKTFLSKIEFACLIHCVLDRLVGPFLCIYAQVWRAKVGRLVWNIYQVPFFVRIFTENKNVLLIFWIVYSGGCWKRRFSNRFAYQTGYGNAFLLILDGLLGSSLLFLVF